MEIGGSLKDDHQNKSGQELKQVRNLEAEANAEATVGTGLLLMASYRTQDYQSRMAPLTMDWALPY